jgi:OHCU decarboxylase
MSSGGIARLNDLPRQELEQDLLACCGSTNWACRMAQSRPFREMDEFLETADCIWWDLRPADWLEAFRQHPKIGGKTAAPQASAQARRWSEQEQAGTMGAPGDILAVLTEANRAYEARFGYIFIICATGKTSEEMLALLEKRLQNDPATELRIAAEEQRKITRLRLEKLLHSG